MKPNLPESLPQAVRRGLRGRCPRCGEGRLFKGWHHLLDACAVCGLRFEREPGDTWFFMYMTTAGLTGSFVVLMFLVRPEWVWLGQIVIGIAAVVVIGLSLPHRKGLAVALNYWFGRERRE